MADFSFCISVLGYLPIFQFSISFLGYLLCRFFKLKILYFLLKYKFLSTYLYPQCIWKYSCWQYSVMHFITFKFLTSRFVFNFVNNRWALKVHEAQRKSLNSCLHFPSSLIPCVRFAMPSPSSLIRCYLLVTTAISPLLWSCN